MGKSRLGEHGDRGIEFPLPGGHRRLWRLEEEVPFCLHRTLHSGHCGPLLPPYRNDPAGLCPGGHRQSGDGGRCGLLQLLPASNCASPISGPGLGLGIRGGLCGLHPLPAPGPSLGEGWPLRGDLADGCLLLCPVLLARLSLSAPGSKGGILPAWRGAQGPEIYLEEPEGDLGSEGAQKISDLLLAL